MFKFEKLIFGDLGWGDELLVAMLMTIAVSICSMGLGLFIAIFAAWAKLTYSKGNVVRNRPKFLKIAPANLTTIGV